MSTQLLDENIKELTEAFLDCEVKTSDMSISEMRAVGKYLRERIKSIDKQSEDDSLGYKKLGKLADERYRLSQILPEIEDALICRQRGAHDYSSIAYNGGGIYTDVSTKSLTNKTGKNGKVRLHGISI